MSRLTYSDKDDATMFGNLRILGQAAVAACVLLGGHRGLADPRPRLRDAIAAVLCLAWAGSAALA